MEFRYSPLGAVSKFVSLSRIAYLFLLLSQFPIHLAAGTVGLQWDANKEGDLAGYNLYRSTQLGSGFSRINTVLIKVTIYDDNVTPGFVYNYVVTAVNTAELESGYSNMVSYDARQSNPDLPPGPNRAPIVSVDPPQKTARRWEKVTLQAAASDPDGDSLSIQWRVVSSNAGSKLSLTGSDTPTMSFVAPGQDDILSFQFSASDGKATATAGAIVTVAGVSSLSFPVSLKGESELFENTFVGLALLNPNGKPIDVVLTALNSTGLETANIWLGSPLPPKGQHAFLTSELGYVEKTALSLMATSKEDPVQGFFMVGDLSLKRLDGLGGQFQESRTLYFPFARRRTGDNTLLYVFNSSKENDPQVALKLYDQDGNLKKETSISLAPSGSFLSTLDKAFGDDLSIAEGFVEVTSSRVDVLLKGFEFYAEADEFSSFSAQAGDARHRLLVPHFFVDNRGGSTEIRLLNVDTDAVKVTVKVFDDKANSIGTREINLAPKKLFVSDLTLLLNLSIPTGAYWVTTGVLDLMISKGTNLQPARVLGTVSFFGNQGKFRSSLAMLSGGQTETVFPHVAQSKGLEMFMGVAVFNPTAATARVRLQAFDVKGIKTAEKEFDLGAGQRILGLLKDPVFFGDGFNQVGGHVRVSALPAPYSPTPVPIITFSLFGRDSLELLAAIEGQSPPY